MIDGQYAFKPVTFSLRTDLARTRRGPVESSGTLTQAALLTGRVKEPYWNPPG